MGQLNILITNDDGIEFPAVTALREELSKLGRTALFAPAIERSATSQAMTIYEDIYVKPAGVDTYIVNGYPVDCVNVALHGEIIEMKFDLVVSGINKGVNMGEDVWYSGTVGAARHAVIHGVPALAVSTGLFNASDDFSSAAQCVRKLIQTTPSLLEAPLLYNVNIPPGINSVEKIKWTKLGSRIYRDKYKKTPIGPQEHGAFLFNLGGSELDHEEIRGTDFEAYYGGFISITPLQNDVTNYERISKDHPK